MKFLEIWDETHYLYGRAVSVDIDRADELLQSPSYKTHAVNNNGELETKHSFVDLMMAGDIFEIESGHYIMRTE